MSEPTTYTYQGKEVTVYRYGQAWFEGQRCRLVEASGEPETYFGDPQHAAAVGAKYPTILNLRELPNGRWVAHFLPDTTSFPGHAAELNRFEEWPKP